MIYIHDAIFFFFFFPSCLLVRFKDLIDIGNGRADAEQGVRLGSLGRLLCNTTPLHTYALTHSHTHAALQPPAVACSLNRLIYMQVLPSSACSNPA